jgi:hypothetical protein
MIKRDIHHIPAADRSFGGTPVFLYSDQSEEEEHYIVQLYSGEDPGLTLFRQPSTREKVVSFYTARTGSVVISVSILENADRYDIPLSLAFSLSWVESNFLPEAVNVNDDSIDRGLFQLNSRSFPELEVDEFFDPYVNAQHGIRYLRKCIELGGNEVVGLAMYNAGRTRVERGGTPRITLNYIARILEYRDQLEKDFSQQLLMEGIVLSDQTAAEAPAAESTS